MKGTILERIIESKRDRVEAAKRIRETAELEDLAIANRTESDKHRFFDAISSRSRINVIAEFKRASPSKGKIAASADPETIARQYERSGAAAISVLTEEDHFLGSLADLATVRSAVSIPLLRKDFIIDDYQILESAASGADAILLIAVCLAHNQLAEFREYANSCGLDTIIEVHNIREMEAAVSAGADIIGVNNRDLKTFNVDLDVSRELVSHAPAGTVMISESGLSTAAQILELHGLGYSAFLIGESLMKSRRLDKKLTEMMSGGLADVSAISKGAEVE